jgi:hypothetical protein
MTLPVEARRNALLDVFIVSIVHLHTRLRIYPGPSYSTNLLWPHEVMRKVLR